MKRSHIFDAVRAMLGRGFKSGEIADLDRAIDRAVSNDIVGTVPATHRQINAAGLKLIKDFEGLRLKAYKCPADVWTIGYGATLDMNGQPIKPGMVITEGQAEDLLRKDLERFEKAVTKKLPTATDNQFAAMVSLAFNVGNSAFTRSTLARKHAAGDYAGAADQFRRWNRSGGRVLAGLSRRRAAETSLYRKVD